MSHQTPPTDSSSERSQGDPWHAFGYLVAGVGMYGGLGWLLDEWLDTRFLVVVGILAGAALGIYMTFMRFNRVTQAPHEESGPK